MLNFRAQLRHTGTKKLQWPHIHRLTFTSMWGYNIYLGGRLFIAVRRPSKYGNHSPVCLGFGRAMLKEHKAINARRDAEAAARG